MSLTYNTGRLKSAYLLTSIPGCKSFSGEDAQGFYNYPEALNNLALAGTDIVLVDSDVPNYDYQTLGMVEYGIRASWLDFISTLVYWDQVPIDTEIEVSTDNATWVKRHFARYDEDSPDGKLYYAFIDGKTSHTAEDAQEVIDIECSDATASSISGKYFFIYSDDEAFYVWFDVDNSSVDPNPASPGGQTLTEIEVNLNTSDSDSVIATKLRAALDAQADFSATLPTNTKVQATVATAGNAYDVLAGDAGLTVSVNTQGGGEESWEYARLA